MAQKKPFVTPKAQNGTYQVNKEKDGETLDSGILRGNNHDSQGQELNVVCGDGRPAM